MTTETAPTAVHASIEVEAPPERAYHVFTAEMGSWWDPDHHLVPGELDEMVVELRPGGRILDRATDGSECVWGTVVAHEPPARFVFSWNITPAWTIETDPSRCSEVELRFTEIDDGRTRVELTHRHLERHGEGWGGMATAVGSPNGWSQGLRRFAEALTA